MNDLEAYLVISHFLAHCISRARLAQVVAKGEQFLFVYCVLVAFEVESLRLEYVHLLESLLKLRRSLISFGENNKVGVTTPHG